MSKTPKPVARDKVQVVDLSFTLTVRTAFWNPINVLPKEDRDQHEKVGRETWSDGKAVVATIQISKKPWDPLHPEAPLDFEDVLVDGATLKTVKKDPWASGVAVTDVRFSAAATNINQAHTALLPPTLQKFQNQRSHGIELALAKVPLTRVSEGYHVLKIVPVDKTTPEGPAGPLVDMPTGGSEGDNKRTYRPLLVRVRFDKDLKILEAVTCQLDKDQKLVVHQPIKDGVVPAPVEIAKDVYAPAWINHGYVTAYRAGELAVDMKPDCLRSVVSTGADKTTIPARLKEPGYAKKSRTFDADTDTIVLHGTSGSLMGADVNTAQGYQWELMNGAYNTQADFDADRAKGSYPKDSYQTTTVEREEEVEEEVEDPATKEKVKKKVKKKVNKVGVKAIGYPLGPHYEIDLDGHVLKLCNDTDRSSHAGKCNFFYFARGNADMKAGAFNKELNNRAIGIEIVNQEELRSKKGVFRAQYPVTPEQAFALSGDAKVKGLLRKLMDKYPSVRRHQIVGHCDVLVLTDDTPAGALAGYTLWQMDDDRLTCPGRQMPWPLLAAAGFGRAIVLEELDAKDATEASRHYGGFFALTKKELREAREKLDEQKKKKKPVKVDPKAAKSPAAPAPAKSPSTPAPDAKAAAAPDAKAAAKTGKSPAAAPDPPVDAQHLTLVWGQSDAKRNWGGIDWKTDEAAKAALAARTPPLTFDGIIQQVQIDLKICGYSVNTDGVFEQRTDAAVRHFIAHTFSGSLLSLIEGDNAPRGTVTRTVAGYIRGSAQAILDDMKVEKPPAPKPAAGTK